MPLTEPLDANAHKTSNPIFEDFYNETFPSLDTEIEKVDHQSQGSFIETKILIL